MLVKYRHRVKVVYNMYNTDKEKAASAKNVKETERIDA